MRTLLLLFLMLLSAPTFAFSQAGTTATLLLFVGLGGFTLANSLMQLCFYFSGLYHNEKFAQNHAALALIPSVIMFAISIYDFTSFGAFVMNLGGILIALALALLPVQLTSVAKAVATPRPFVITITSTTFLILGSFLAPLSLFAVILGYLGYQMTKGASRYINLIIGIVAISLLGYWLWQLLQSAGV